MTEYDRAAFRRFVREHHPDRGGDPETFVAGLARFGSRPGSGSGSTPPEADDWADDWARFDRPIEVVPTLSFPVRVGVALIRTWHRRRHGRVE